jgi:hypothetical protein
MARPPSVIVLIPIPSHSRTRTAATRESGIAVRLMNVVRTFQRNRNRTTVTMTPPSTRAALTLPMARWMKSAWRKAAASTRTSGGRLGRRAARVSSIPCHLEGVGVRLLLNGGHHGRGCVEAAVAALMGGADADGGDVLEQDRRAASNSHDRLGEILRRVEADGALARAVARVHGRPGGRGHATSQPAVSGGTTSASVYTRASARGGSRSGRRRLTIRAAHAIAKPARPNAVAKTRKFSRTSSITGGPARAASRG